MLVPVAFTGITLGALFLGAVAMAAEPAVISPAEAKISWTGPIFENAQTVHHLREHESLKRFETAGWFEPDLPVPRMGVAFEELPPQRVFVDTRVLSLDEQIQIWFARFVGTVLQLPGGGGGEPPYGTWETRKFDIRHPDRSCLCQWRSKKGPPRRCKKGPLGGCGLVPVVHGRAPRATRCALNRLTRRRAREGPVGPRGQAWAGWSVQLAVGV